MSKLGDKVSRKRSGAWKDLERSTARALGGQRILRGDDFRKSVPDVFVADRPRWKVDCKYKSSGWAHHKILDEVRRKYCAPGDVGIIVTKSGGQKGAVVSMALEDFVLIVAALRGSGGFLAQLLETSGTMDQKADPNMGAMDEGEGK